MPGKRTRPLTRKSAPDPPLAPGNIALYAVAIFLGASLLFLVQPLIARVLLPLLGGTPAVWTTAMVFFQAMLLGGYLYAHLLARSPLRRQLVIHAVVLGLAALLLPIGLPATWRPPTDGSPTLWTIGALAASVGAPFFALSSAGPLLQSWFARTGTKRAKDPYFLYAASNAGSMLALLAYPLWVEPSMKLASQRLGWSWGYAAFAGVMLAAGLVMLRSRTSQGIAAPADTKGAIPGIPRKTRLWWIFLAFVPSSAMLGVTQHLTSEVAVFPLLWVIPLAIYLLTFIIVFSRGGKWAVAGARFLLPFVAVAVVVLIAISMRRPFAVQIVIHLMALLLIGLVCHGRLAAERPAPARLTDFYLMMAVGGVLGGLFNSIMAPAIFNWIFEYPLIVAAACLALPRRAGKSRAGKAHAGKGRAAKGRAGRARAAKGRPAKKSPDRPWIRQVYPAVGLMALIAVLMVVPEWIDDRKIAKEDWPKGLYEVLRQAPGALLALALFRFREPFALAVLLIVLVPRLWPDSEKTVIHSERTFFGVHRVVASKSDDLTWHKLIHGTTRHGLQSRTPPMSLVPTSYYSQTGPIGDVIELLQESTVERRIAIVGLGAGTLAAYGRPDWHMTYYEIDPEVVRIARDPNLFTYLSDTRSPVEVVLGDARLSIARTPAATYDAIVLDAFSSDAVPVHLITREALTIYLEKLKPDGLIAVHISNWYLNLEPVLAAAARDLGLVARIRFDAEKSEADRRSQKSKSIWVVLTRSHRALGSLDERESWTKLRRRNGVTAWTDDYSSIMAVLQW